MTKLSELQGDPAKFRAGLSIDCDGLSRRLAEVCDGWQAADFEALDAGWRSVAGHDADGPRRAWLERPRGHSKTLDLAVMASWCLFASRRRLRGYALAGDQDQAKLLRDAVDGLLRMNPWLADILQADKLKVENGRTGSTLEILTSDAPTSYGLTPDFCIADEVVHWRQRELWDSVISSAAKRKDCMFVVITNAGFEDSWQWEVREAVRREPTWHFSRLESPRASWITADRLDEQRRLLPSIAYRRLWLNEWSSGSGDALEPSDIDAALTLKGPTAEPEPGWCYVAGLDLGLRRDASALVVLGVHVGWSESVEREPALTDRQRMMIDAGVVDPPDPEWEHRREEGTGRLRVCSVDVWEPGRGRVSIDEIEKRILQLDERFRFDAVAVDVWQAEQLVERLNRQGVAVRAVDFTPANLKAMATATLEAFSEGRMELYDHPKLTADLRALRVEERNYGVRLVPGQTKHGTRHGDAATALAIALMLARKGRFTFRATSVIIAE